MFISIICVYNNEKQYNSILVDSLNKQECSYELIGINNSDKTFDSAAAALNYGVEKSKGDILVFAHQDVYIKEAHGLALFGEEINKGNNGDIFGVAGAKERIKHNIGTYTSGTEMKPEMKMVDWKRMEVSCVDECIFGMKKITYENHPFDPELCNNWHLYCVESCLYARSKGNSIFILPMQIHHFSNGTISNEYMSCLRGIIKKYHNSFQYIWTCAYKVRCNSVMFSLIYVLWKCKRKLLKLLMIIRVHEREIS